MSKIVQLKAAPRARAGKGASRAVRRQGLVPGVVYGDRKEPQLVALNYGELKPHVETGRFMATLVDLEVEGQTVRAIPRDVQFEPVRDFIVHVDFLRLGKDARVAVAIPVHFKNHELSPGLKAGGVLNIVSHEISLYCTAEFIPDEIMVDLTGLHINQSIHLSQVKLPPNVKPVAHGDLTVAAISAMGKEEEVVAEAPAAAEVPATAQKAPVAAPGTAAPAAAAGKDAKPAAAAPAKGAAPAATAAPAPKKK
ncbi:MAG: 50S ribosomal protein L25/general stress protein Ctc [Rhizobiales bacterium]|nr:50S ribosomal protein L25/general stress protein Ctc [Hyphomicrobiales bacterium]MBI3672400.1 50S ribosomal protein L25/general stress protein Ctc [Hyphomicrobiales bacterium]